MWIGWQPKEENKGKKVKKLHDDTQKCTLLLVVLIDGIITSSTNASTKF